MKKILVMIMVALLLFAFPIVAYADEASTTVVETEVATASEDTTAKESAAEGLISPPTDTTEETDLGQLFSKKIEEWILPHLEEISVVITLIASSFYQKRKHRILNKSIGVLNNNSVTLAETSTSLMNTALTDMKDVARVVDGNSTIIAELLEKYKQSEEDKKKLEDTLAAFNKHLETSKKANIEFANELAELLVLANIPNSKKDELYSRHVAAVHAIEEAEAEEVKKDDGEKT